MLEKPDTTQKIPMKKGPKPLLIITWTNVFGWIFSGLIICGCMFTVGIMVGRDIAPINFDIKKISTVQDCYVEEVPSLKSGRNPNLIQPDDLLREIHERLLDNSSKEKPSSPEPELSESSPKTTEPPATNAPPASDEKNQTPASPESLAQVSDIPDTSMAEDDGGILETESADVKPEAPKPAEIAGVRYVIQVSSLTDKNSAQSIIETLIAKGYRAYCLPAQIHGKLYFRVRIGPYQDPSVARDICARLNALLVVEDGQSLPR